MQSVAYCFSVPFFVVLVFMSSVAHANSAAPTVFESRYMVVQPGPTESQQNLFQTIADIQVPPYITTIGDAIDHILAPFGFQMLDGAAASKEQSLLVVLPLPNVHRVFGPISLKAALTTMGGEAFDLVVNPVLRTVSYRLKPAYRQYVSTEDIERAYQRGLELTKAASLLHYGPLKAGETLSRVSLAVGLGDAMLDQRMVQIFRANPEAFDNNMNVMRIGAMLVIPPMNANRVSAQTARRVVEDHHRRWQQRVSK